MFVCVCITQIQSADLTFGGEGDVECGEVCDKKCKNKGVLGTKEVQNDLQ